MKDRWPLLAKGNAGLTRISRSKTAHDRLDLVLEGPLKLMFQRPIEQPLALAHRQRRATQQLFAEGLYLCIQPFSLD